MDWTVIFSLPGLLVIGTIYFFILWIKRYFDDKRTRKYLFERNQQLEKEVKEKNAR